MAAATKHRGDDSSRGPKQRDLRRVIRASLIALTAGASCFATSVCEAMITLPDSDEDALRAAEDAAGQAVALARPRYKGTPAADWATFAEWLFRKRALISFAETNYEVFDPYDASTAPTSTEAQRAVRIHAARKIAEMWLDYVDSHKTRRPRSAMPWNLEGNLPLPLLDNLYTPPEMQKARRALRACVGSSTANATWNDDSRACLRHLYRRFDGVYSLPVEEFVPSPNRTPALADDRPQPVRSWLSYSHGPAR